MKYIGFRVIWDIQATEENGNLGGQENLKEGRIFWREDQILGFNNGGSDKRTQLILETESDMEGNIMRATFTVDEPIEEVEKKLNG